jgi:predicted CxxxxCH...CXXCH cytochrome family protein
MSYRTRRVAAWTLFGALGACAPACLAVNDDLENDGGTGGECGSCHSALGNSAAHASHVSGAGSYEKSFACSECHPVPTSGTSDGTHMNAAVDLVFPSGGLARADGAAPAWDGAGCTGVYCHGATLGGGTYTTPLWNDAAHPDGMLCGYCHSTPPPAPHPDEDINSCGECHEGAISGGWPVPAKHVNGQVDFGGGDGFVGAQP